MNQKATSGREVVPYDPAKLERDQRRVARGFWPKLRRLAAHLPFVKEMLAAYFAAMDPKTPTYVKAVLMGALAYFVLPIDMIPDFIAAFGYSDDAAVLLTAVRTVSGHIKPEHEDQAERTLADLRDDTGMN